MTAIAPHYRTASIPLSSDDAAVYSDPEPVTTTGLAVLLTIVWVLALPVWAARRAAWTLGEWEHRAISARPTLARLGLLIPATLIATAASAWAFSA